MEAPEDATEEGAHVFLDDHFDSRRVWRALDEGWGLTDGSGRREKRRLVWPIGIFDVRFLRTAQVRLDIAPRGLFRRELVREFRGGGQRCSVGGVLRGLLDDVPVTDVDGHRPQPEEQWQQHGNE